MTRKFFCYVDETGQDTNGKFFIVSVIVTDQERQGLYQICEKIEDESQKGRRKWNKTAHNRRIAYIRQILADPVFVGKLNYAVYHDENDYTRLTIETIKRTLNALAEEDCEVTVFIDGLQRTLERNVGLQLRRSGFPTKKVRGLNDENDALIRLADAVCGLVRSAAEQKLMMRELLEQGVKTGIFKNLLEK